MATNKLFKNKIVIIHLIIPFEGSGKALGLNKLGAGIENVAGYYATQANFLISAERAEKNDKSEARWPNPEKFAWIRVHAYPEKSGRWSGWEVWVDGRCVWEMSQQDRYSSFDLFQWGAPE